ncbi:MAG: outer membrane lipoprotein carrier protein LolA [Pseudomonadota bacterium]
MQRIVVTLVLFFLTAALPTTTLSAAESSVLDQIGEKISQYPVIRAEFIQTKQMQALKRPLITTGQFTYAQSDGVLWQITQPYHISYVLGEDKIVEIDANGLRKERGLREVAGLAQVGRVFRAVLGANASALHSYFDITVPNNSEQNDVGKWQLILKPKQQQISKSLSMITLSGSQFVETIVITEASGDSTTLRFKNIQGFKKTQGVATLTESELQLFGKPTIISKSAAP